MWLRDGLFLGLWPLGKVCVNQRSRTMYLCSILFLTYIFICREEVDHRIWKSSPSGVFFTNFFMRSFEMMREVKYSTSLVWVGLAPSRVEALCHLAISTKVSIADILIRRGISIEDICMSTLLEGEEGD